MNANNREEKKIAEKTIKRINEGKSDYWTKRAEEVSLDLFHDASRRVPAYKDFLKKNKINPSKIKNFDDFKLVPPTSKENYLLLELKPMKMLGLLLKTGLIQIE